MHVAMEEIVTITVVGANASAMANLARTMVDERLVACVQRVLNVRSTYRWQGAVHEAEEVMLVMHSTREMVDAIEARVTELHVYTVPQIVVMDCECATPYAEWVRECVSPEVAGASAGGSRHMAGE